MPETPHTPPVESSHSMRNRVIAGSALATTLVGTPLAVELSPDIFSHQDHSNTPHHVSYPTRRMARLEPSVKKVTIPKHSLKSKAEASEHQTEAAPHHNHKKAHIREVIELKGKLKTDQGEMPSIIFPKTPSPEAPSSEAPTQITEAEVPPEISQIMHDNTAYIGGCSAFLIRNAQNTPIGAYTAEHCSLKSQDGHWGGTPEKRTIDLGRAFTVSVGDMISELTQVGQVTQALVNAEGDTTHDQAYLAFDNHSMDEVLANSQQMSADEIAALPKGSVIYNSGWPVNQKNNSGPLKRQEFAMRTLGVDTMHTNAGEDLNVLYALVSLTPDGAECSWGNSGSAAFIRTASGQTKIIGVASAFNDWGYLANKDPEKAQAEINLIKDQFNVEFDENKFVGICGFAFEPPKAEDGAVLADVINPEQTPPNETMSPAEQRITNRFFDPNEPRAIIDGFVSVSGGKGEFTVDRPAIYYDKESDTTYLAYYSGGGNRHLYLTAISGKGFDGLDRLKVYSRDGETKPILDYHTGAIIEQDDQASYFKDEHGYVFAGGARAGLPEGAPLDNVVLHDGTFSLESVNKQQDVQQAFAEMRDPAFPRVAVDGMVPLDQGNDRLSRWINKPFVFYNPNSGGVVIIYADNKEVNGSGYQYFESLDDVRVYADTDSEPVATETVTGKLEYRGNASGATHGGYALEGATELFSQLLDPAPETANSGQVYKFIYQDGALKLQPTNYNPGNPDTKKVALTAAP